MQPVGVAAPSLWTLSAAQILPLGRLEGPGQFQRDE